MANQELDPLIVRIKAVDETGDVLKNTQKNINSMDNASVKSTTDEINKMSGAMRAMVGIDVFSKFSKQTEPLTKNMSNVRATFEQTMGSFNDVIFGISEGTIDSATMEAYRNNIKNLGDDYLYAALEQQDFLLGMDQLYAGALKNNLEPIISAQSNSWLQADLMAEKYGVDVRKMNKLLGEMTIANPGLLNKGQQYAYMYTMAQQDLNEYQTAQIANMMLPMSSIVPQLKKNIKGAFALAGMGWNADNIFGGTDLYSLFHRKGGILGALFNTKYGMSEESKALVPAGMVIKDFRMSTIESFKNIKFTLESNRMAWKAFGAQAKTALSPIRDRLDAIGGAIKSFIYAFPGATAAVSALTGAFVSLAIGMKQAYEQAKKIDEIGDTADRLGSSYEQVYKYSKMADIYGYSSSDFESAFKKMRVNLAKGDSGTASALSTLGIETAGKDNTEVFDEIVEALQRVDDQTQKTALAYKIFGKNCTSLTPLLNAQADDVKRVSEAYKILGSQVGDEAVHNSDILENDLAMLSEAWEGLKNSFTGFIPAIDWLVSKLTLIIGYTTVLLDLIFGVKVGLEDATETISDTADAASEAADAVEELTAGMRSFDELNDLSFDSSDSDTSLDLDEEDISQSIGLATSLSDTMNDTLDKIESFRIKVSEFQENYGTLMPWILMLGGALGGIICLLLGHPVLALGFFALAGTGAAALVSQLGNFETISTEEGTWNTYFDELATQLDNSVGKVLTPTVIGVLSCLAGVLMLIFGGLALKCIGIGLLVAGGWMLAQCGNAEDLDENGTISWTEFMTSVKTSILSGSEELKKCATIFSAIAGILLLLFAPTLKTKLIGIVLIGAAIALNASVGSNITNLSEDTGTFKALFINSFAGMSDLVGPEVGQKLMIIGVITTVVGLLVLFCAPGLTLKKMGIFAILAGLGMTAIGGLSQTDFDQLTEDGFNFKTIIVNAFSGFSEVASSTFAQVSSIVMVIGGLLLLCFGPTVGLKASGIVLMLAGLGIGALGSISKSTWQQLADGNTEGFKNSIAVDLGLTWKYKENDDGTTTEIRKATGINSDWMKYSNITFAHGGFVQSSYSTGNITIGEDGREAIIPLEKNTEWADLVADRLSERMGTTNGNTTIVLEIDGKQFAKTTVKSINDLTKSTGRLALNLA